MENHRGKGGKSNCLPESCYPIETEGSIEEKKDKRKPEAGNGNRFRPGGKTEGAGGGTPIFLLNEDFPV